MDLTRTNHRAAQRGTVPADLFADLPGVSRVSGPEHTTLAVTYHDTADLRLARAGITVSCDATGSWQARIPDADPIRSGEPDVIAAALRAYTGERPLRECARLTIHSATWRLRGAHDELLAELRSDTVRAHTSGPDGVDETGWPTVLLTGADPELRDTLRQRLRAAHQTPTRSPGTDLDLLARALGDRLPTPAARPVTPKSTAADAVLAYVDTQLRRLRRADLAFRQNDATAVPDLRSAVRRLRGCLRTFAPILGRGRCRQLRAELGWLSDQLGEVRTHQLLRAHLDQGITALPAEVTFGPIHADLDRHWAKPEAAADAELRAALSTHRYLELLARLDELLARPRKSTESTAPARTALPPLIRREYLRLHRAVESAGPAAHPDDEAPDAAPDGRTALHVVGPHHKGTRADAERAARLHNVRKAAARLRYASEVAEPVLPGARRTRRRAARVQRALGVHRDLITVRDALRELAVRTHATGANTYSLGILHGRADILAPQHENDFRAHWQRLAAPKATRWLR